MAERRRWSIGTLMVVVLFVAANCAAIRSTLAGWADGWIIVFLPMLNLLILGFLRMKRRPEARPFWLAFETVGWTMLALLALAIWYRPERINILANWFIQAGWVSMKTSIDAGVAYLVFALVYSVPLILVASIVGWLSEGYRLVIVRRPRSVDSIGSTSVNNS